MSLKQLDNFKRILFLQEFISEVVINSAEDERLKRIIKVAKLKRKHIENEQTPIENGDAFSKTGKEGDMSGYNKSLSVSENEKPLHMPVNFKPSFKRNQLPKKLVHKSTFAHQQLSPVNSMSGNARMQTLPHSTPTPPGNPLLKLDSFINDASIQIIECPGPGKNILVKVRNRINTTNTILSEVEIKNIINHFSKTTKIPILGGILKTSLGNLLISAITSDYAGSRFIINKQSPYSLIEATQNL